MPDTASPPTPPTPPDGDIASTGKSFGRLLREEREQRGMSLAELATRTRIRKHHLEALERDDFGALPGDVFVKGFLRSCAQTLGVEADLMIADYERQRALSAEAGEGDRVVREMSRVLHVDEATRGRRRAQLASVLVVVALLAAGGWWLWGRAAREPAPRTVVESSLPVRSVPPADVPAPVEAPLPVDTTVAGDTLEPVPASAAEATPEEQAVAIEPEPEPEPEPVTATATAQPNAAPTPAPTPAPAEPGALRVTDHGVGTGLVDRALAGQSDRFPVGSRVVFWTRVLDGQAGDTIDHVWLRNGIEQDRMTLRIGAAHWRTHSKKTLYGAPGDRWAAEARDASGRVLARSDFVTD